MKGNIRMIKRMGKVSCAGVMDWAMKGILN
jgi:hypothetical protein